MQDGASGDKATGLAQSNSPQLNRQMKLRKTKWVREKKWALAHRDEIVAPRFEDCKSLKETQKLCRQTKVVLQAIEAELREREG